MKNKVQNKWSVIATYLILIFVARIQTVALDIQLVAKVPAPTNQVFVEASVVGYKDNGSALIKLKTKNGKSLGLCCSASGVHRYFESSGYSTIISTNLVKILQQDGKNIIFVDEVIVQATTNKNGILILKTLSQNGYISDSIIINDTQTNRFKMINGAVDSYEEFFAPSIYRYAISKHDGSNAVVSEKSVVVSFYDYTYLDFAHELSDVNSNNHMFASIKDGFIEVYRVVDDELLPTNTVSLSSRTAESMTVSVINQDRSTLRMQTSTNLTDWNNVKSSPANKYLNVEMPAEGEKKFLRIVK